MFHRWEDFQCLNPSKRDFSLNTDGQNTSKAIVIAEGENTQKTAKNVIQGGNLSPDLVCTNKSLLALLKADVSSAGKSLSRSLTEGRHALWLL